MALGIWTPPRDHLVITSHRPLLGLLPKSVLTTPDQAPGASPSHIRSHSQNPGRNAPPRPWGYGCPLRSLGNYIPSSSPRTPTWIGSDHTRPVPMGLSQSLPKSWPEPWSECTPTALGTWIPPEITWPACDNHTTMRHSCHLISRPPSRRTWDLRVPTLFPFNLFLSYCMLMLL